MGAIFSDIRYGARSLLRRPVLAGAVAITLLVGIGLNTAVFAVVEGMWFRPRIEKDPDSFVQMLADYPDGPGSPEKPGEPWTTSLAGYRAFREGAHSISDFAAWRVIQARVDDDVQVELPLLVTCEFFSLYGLEHASQGRLFRPDECTQKGAARVAIVSEEMWRSRFLSAPGIVGARIRLNQRVYTIVGVAPKNFPGRLRGGGIWIPYTMQPDFYAGRDLFQEPETPWLYVEGRSTPGIHQGRGRSGDERPRRRHSRKAAHDSHQRIVFAASGAARHDAGNCSVAGRDHDLAAIADLLQCHIAVTGARRGASARDRGAPGTRRGSRAAAADVAHRRLAAGGRRGKRGSRLGLRNPRGVSLAVVARALLSNEAGWRDVRLPGWNYVGRGLSGGIGPGAGIVPLRFVAASEEAAGVYAHGIAAYALASPRHSGSGIGGLEHGAGNRSGVVCTLAIHNVRRGLGRGYSANIGCSFARTAGDGDAGRLRIANCNSE